MKNKKVIYLLLILIIVALILVKTFCFSNRYEIFVVNEKNRYLDMHLVANSSFYGYADDKGNVVIKPKYIMAQEFSEGLAVVKSKNEFGYIDKNGNMVIKSKFTYLHDFHEGVAVIGVGEHEGSPYLDGLIDKEGRVIIPPTFREINDFSEGLAVTFDSKNNKYGYIDKTGKVFIDFKFNQAHDFKNGIAFVKVGEKLEKINNEGEFIQDNK